MENLIEQAAKSGRCWMGGRRVVQPEGFKTVDSPALLKWNLMNS